MGTGYTRNDTPNNIADGNVINASDLDGEFDAVQAAFNGSTGHSHDGTTGEGPQIATAGLADNAVTTAKITDANVTLAKMAANSVDSDQYVDGSIDTAHIGNLQVTTAKIAADAIDGTKLADNAVDSEHYTDGSIDRVHLAADIVDGTKIADDSIDSEHYVDGSIDTAHIADDAVTSAKLDTNIQIAGTLGVTGETTLSTHLNMGDNDIIKLGAGADLQIYHDGSNSYILDNGTGNLRIRATDFQLQDSSGFSYIEMTDNGSGGTVDLKYNASTRLTTTSAGIDVTGTVTANDKINIDASNNSRLNIKETTSTDQNTQFLQTSGDLLIRTLNDAETVATSRIALDHATGDISFYEDTGTTPKLFWDASAESLEVGGIETTQQSPLMVKTDTNNFAIYLEENSGQESWQVGVNVNGDLGFYNSGSATASVAIDDSGNVGIGTSSPTQKLSIAAASALVDITSTTGTSFNGLEFKNSSGSFYIGQDNSAGTFYGAANARVLYSTGAYPIAFFTNGSNERMRIFSNGRVGLADGTTPEDSAQLDVKRNSSDIVYFRNNSGTGVKLTAGNQSFSAVSDENKKENIVELDKQQSYDNIKNIRAVTYNFRDIVKTNEDGTTTTYEDDKNRIGFISQDWETNYSQLVNTDSEGVKSLLYTETTPVLLSALQKAQEKIEALEARIVALETA